jgi:hypothetical protein
MDRRQQFCPLHWAISSVIINDLNIVSVAVPPHETHSPLIIDTDAVSAPAVATKFLQPIAGRNAQILQRSRMVQHNEFSARRFLDAQKAQAATTIEERLSVSAPETRDRVLSYYVLRYG